MAQKPFITRREEAAPRGVLRSQTFKQKAQAHRSAWRVLRRKDQAATFRVSGKLAEEVFDVGLVRPLAEQPRDDRRQRVIDDQEPAQEAIDDARMVEMLADGPDPWAGSVPQHGIRQRA